MGSGESADDLVDVDVICMRGGESWSWRGWRRSTAERAMAKVLTTLPDARSRVTLVRSAVEVAS